MPRSSPIQPGFGGEISPRLWGAVDSEPYKLGLEAALNWEPTLHRSVLRRGGSFFAADLPAGNQVRLIPLRTRDEQDYVLVLTDRQLRIYSEGGGVLISNPGLQTELVVGGDFSGGLSGWTVSPLGAVTVPAGAAVFSSGWAMPGGWTQGYLGQNFTIQKAVDVVVGFDIVAFAGSNAPCYFQLGGPLSTVAGSAAGKPTGTLLVNAALPAYEAAGRRTFNLHLEPGTYGFAFIGVSTDATHHPSVDNFSIAYSSTGGPDGFAMDAPWTGDQVASVKFATESAADRIYLVHKDVAPYYIQRTAGATWTVQPMALTSTPGEWVAGNYPSVAELFQSRLWLGGTRDQRNKLWASRVGNPFDFTTTTGADVLTTDSIIAPVATKGGIQWLAGRQALLIGTDLAEHSIASSNGVLSPSDMQVRLEGAFGSSPAQNVDLGDQVMFVTRDRRRVRAIDFDLQSNAWLSRDLTFVAEHITDSPILEAHHARNPNGTLVLLLASGKLALCSYDRAEKVNAWWRAELANATILSAAVSNGPSGSVLYLAASRPWGNQLEAIPFSEYHPKRVYLDGVTFINATGTQVEWQPDLAYNPGDQVAYRGASYFASVPTQGTTPDTAFGPWTLMAAIASALTPAGAIVLYGLARYEGLTVDAVVDGQVDQGVVAGGRLELHSAGASVQLGFSFRSTGRTLRPEGGNPAGTAQASRRRWAQVFVRLNRSALPLVNGERAAERDSAAATDASTPLVTGDVSVHAASWDDDGRILFEQDLPVRTEILAVFGVAQVNQT